MSFLEGSVIAVTGAGQGLGREEALALSRRGAHVVVNDVGWTGSGSTSRRAADVVTEEILALGGEASSNTDDVATPQGAAGLIQQAFGVTGELHALVCNAGIVRDRMLFKMSPEEWEDVVRVDLGGHFYPTRYAAERWRNQAKDGTDIDARVVYTTSEAGLYGHLSQANYAAAKAGITGLCFTAAGELAPYGVKVNTISPRGRTPMTVTAMGEIPGQNDDFDVWDPSNVAPFVVFLARPEARHITGQVFVVYGGTVSRLEGWQKLSTIECSHRWNDDDLLARVSEQLIPDLSAQGPQFPETL